MVEPGSKFINILVVDDSEDDTLLMMTVLRKGGYDPSFEQVETPEEMIQALEQRYWDTVIIDYVMPEFSGLDALQMLKATGKDVPVIVVSGKVGEDVAVETMKAGAHDYVLKSNLTRLPMAIEHEIHEAENRRQRRLAEQQKQELEARAREFYRRTILAATEGKLHICQQEEIEHMAGKPAVSWATTVADDINDVRDGLEASLLSFDVPENWIPSLVGPGLEADANAIKHGGGGSASLHRLEESVLFVVRDNGPGIEDLFLPDVALTKGYTTAKSMGMGYKIMISCADNVYLTTGPEGTVVAIEMKLHRDKALSPYGRIPACSVTSSAR